jgi:hypothetical protein
MSVKRSTRAHRLITKSTAEYSIYDGYNLMINDYADYNLLLQI